MLNDQEKDRIRETQEKYRRQVKVRGVGRRRRRKHIALWLTAGVLSAVLLSTVAQLGVDDPRGVNPSSEARVDEANQETVDDETSQETVPAHNTFSVEEAQGEGAVQGLAGLGNDITPTVDVITADQTEVALGRESQNVTNSSSSGQDPSALSADKVYAGANSHNEGSFRTDKNCDGVVLMGGKNKLNVGSMGPYGTFGYEGTEGVRYECGGVRIYHLNDEVIIEGSTFEAAEEVANILNRDLYNKNFFKLKDDQLSLVLEGHRVGVNVGNYSISYELIGVVEGEKWTPLVYEGKVYDPVPFHGAITVFTDDAKWRYMDVDPDQALIRFSSKPRN